MITLFKNIPAFEKEALLKNIKIKSNSYLRDEVIVSENDLCESIKYVKKGLVVAKNIYYDGHETIIKVILPGDSFGEALLYSSNPYYKATFVSEANTVIETLTKDDLEYLLENKTIMKNYINSISDSLVLLNNHIKILNQKSVKGRLCLFLYYEYLKTKATTFTINLNKTELAQFLNAERPTLSKELHELINQGIIANVGYSYTIIDINKIQEQI